MGGIRKYVTYEEGTKQHWGQQAILTTGMSSLSSHMVLIIRGSAIPAALRQSGRKRSGEISLFHINTNFFYSSEGDAQMCTQIPHSKWKECAHGSFTPIVITLVWILEHQYEHPTVQQC